MKFSFTRIIRTSSSESYAIWGSFNIDEPMHRIGILDIHFEGRLTYGNLILEKKIDSDELDFLISEVDTRLINSDREDFIVTVYFGKEIAYYSDSITDEDRDSHSVTQSDLKDIRTSLSRVIGKHQIARGKLTEHAICAYFQYLNYHAERAGSEFDALKVDVIAESDNEIIYVQSKFGKVSAGEMKKIVASISSLPRIAEKNSIAAIVAKEFPANSESLRRVMELEFKIPIMCIQLYQIYLALPEYRHALEIKID